jgi:hypothetical protein
MGCCSSCLCSAAASSRCLFYSTTTVPQLPYMPCSLYTSHRACAPKYDLHTAIGKFMILYCTADQLGSTRVPCQRAVAASPAGATLCALCCSCCCGRMTDT